MKKRAGLLGLVLLAVAGLSVGYLLGGAGDSTEYTVVRGDTLGKIAKSYDVTVDQLRDWNHISGDLIEVGDILVIYGNAPEGETPAPAPRRRSSKPSPAPTSGGTELRMPSAKPCLAGPTGEGLAEVGAVASAGLSYEQIKSSMDRFVPTTLRCVPEGTAGRMHTKMKVGCNGLVELVEIESQGGLPDDVASCVQDTLRYAAFPAHDLPDGEVFEYPLTFSWE